MATAPACWLDRHDIPSWVRGHHWLGVVCKMRRPCQFADRGISTPSNLKAPLSFPPLFDSQATPSCNIRFEWACIMQILPFLLVTYQTVDASCLLEVRASFLLQWFASCKPPISRRYLLLGFNLMLHPCDKPLARDSHSMGHAPKLSCEHVNA